MTSSYKTVIIDDADPSHVNYNGKWDVRNKPQEYASTAHGSGTVGSFATIKFTGVAISFDLVSNINIKQRKLYTSGWNNT